MRQCRCSPEDRRGGSRAQHPATRQHARENCFSPCLYRNRNLIKRVFGRLKGFRRIATRYDRSAASFMTAIHIVATTARWL
ncbi:Mobile element protein [Azospirillum argentinense]